MSHFGFSVSTKDCVGCKACEIACKNRNELKSPGPRLRHVVTKTVGEFPNVKVMHMSMACMHCADPACLKACPAGAIVKLEDGAVVGVRDKCIGCHYCYFACPFGVPQYRDEDGTMIKCDSCIDRRKQGLEPACAHTCFYGGLEAGDLSELAESKVNEASLMAAGTEPSLISDADLSDLI